MMDTSIQPQDDASPHSLFDSLKAASLKTAGYAYVIGDAALFAAGVLEKDPRGMATAAIWGLGGVAAARYGNSGPEKQAELLCHNLGDYLMKQGVVIPPNPTTEMLIRPGGAIERIETFFYEHPSEALNTIHALGARQFVDSGFSQKFVPDVASGVLIRAGALAGLLLPEQVPNPAHPRQGMFGKALTWAQERPLRLPSMIYTANNATMIWAALAKHKENPGQHSYMLRFAAAGVYIFANTMLGMSSKVNPAANSPEVMARLAEVSAQVIAAQPEAVQEALLQNIAGYIAAQRGVNRKPDEIAAELHAKLRAFVAPVTPEQGASWQTKVAGTQVAETPGL